MELTHLFEKIVKNSRLHAKFLNTLSYMENAGARKISACEHPVLVNKIQLKHAAEEHRHAYYLKKQIDKLNPDWCSNYHPDELIAPFETRNFLQQLDIKTCRYLKQAFQLDNCGLKYAAYLFVTYAIEVRADDLYPIYQDVLTKNKQRVMVKSIILEEEGHLEEMIVQLKHFSDDWRDHAAHILQFERKLFENWVNALIREVR